MYKLHTKFDQQFALSRKLYSSTPQEKKMANEINIFHNPSTARSSILQIYDKTEESLSEEVQKLKDWMKTQHHLPEMLDDHSVENFLILNKFRTERAKKGIDMYYSFRSKLPDFAGTMNPTCPNMKQVAEMMYYVPLPKMTKEMYRVMIYKSRIKGKIEQVDPYDVFRMSTNLAEMRLKQDIMFGEVIIFDMDGMTIPFLSKLTPVYAAKTMTVYKVYSLPLKRVFIVNTVPYVSTLMTVIKAFLKPKIFERIHVCKDTSILREHLPLEMLPSDYGGTEKSIEQLHELTQRRFRSYQERFDLLDELRVNESLRPSELEKENDEILGFHGNFKKLDID
ncbi:uncharacterized protein LOC135133460 isoform X2 [Zophobas morio]|uniref:uncharacterized protein LOC135133460 isoform X2 n=1 Tax=Zophobas morio TaxID=2755281 RepID=UPI003082DE90